MTLDPVIMLGTFPPPLGGAAKNNAVLYDSLRTAGRAAVKLDTSAASSVHRRTMMYHAERFYRNVRALGRAWALGTTRSVLYCVPNAGTGAWYTWAHVSLAGRTSGSIVLHHRSFRYIDQWSRPIAHTVQAHRMKTTHVFLSLGMAEEFERCYGPTRSLIASNARFVSAEAAEPATQRAPGPLVVGHLSNLCAEKGFFDVADAFERVRLAGIPARLVLAGPIVEPEVTVRLNQLRKAYGTVVHYEGPLSGVAKRDFYRQLDIFLFPTRFKQEAAPNVIYEALAAGAPVLAFDRGCIREMLPDECGAVCPRSASFSAFVLRYLREFPITAQATATRRCAIKAAIAAECRVSEQQYQALMRLLGAPAAGVIQAY